MNKNVLKGIVYGFFNPVGKEGQTTNGQIRKEIEKIVNEDGDVPSLYSSIWRAEATRHAQMIHMCLKMIIKVSFLSKPKSKEEKAAKELINIMVSKHNKTLTIPFTRHELGEFVSKSKSPTSKR